MKDNEQRSRLAIMMIGILTCTFLSSIVFLFFEINFYQKIQSGNATFEGYAVYEKIDDFLWKAKLTALFLAFISCLTWEYRAYKNLERSEITSSHKSIFVILHWFIPLVNFSRPLSNIKEIWRKTQLLPFSETEYPDVSIKKPILPNLWWFSILVGGFLSWFSLSFRMVPSIENQIIGNYGLIYSHTFLLPAIILSLLLVRQIAAFEKRQP